MARRRGILTIGYGNRSRDDLLALLRGAGVQAVVDVRSSPRAGFNSDYDRSALEQWLPAANFRYAFMGDSLGGRPDDPSCYDADGHVDYERCRVSGWFTPGIDRIVADASAGELLCLLCSELRPSECHRYRLLAGMLVERGAPVRHFDPQGRLIDHTDVAHMESGGQLTLIASPLGRSRRRYGPGSRSE